MIHREVVIVFKQFVANVQDFTRKLEATADADKRSMMEKQLNQCSACAASLKGVTQLTKDIVQNAVNKCKDPLAIWLDKQV